MSKPKHKILRNGFLVWQCQIRQIAMREQGGRPSSGMCPRVLNDDGEEFASALTLVLVPKKPEESTAFFRFQVMKSTDPREIYEKALRYLQAEYFQEPKTFSDRLLATLPGVSPLADALVAARHCVLDFAQGRYAYRVPCTANLLSPDDPACAAAIWHNRVFNPALPDTVQVIGFEPEWKTAEIKK